MQGHHAAVLTLLALAGTAAYATAPMAPITSMRRSAGQRTRCNMPPYAQTTLLDDTPHQAEPIPSDHPARAITRVMQAGVLAAGASALAFRPGTSPMDPIVAWCWSTFDSAASITLAPMFEANLAVAAFVLWIALFESIHLWLPNAARWRLDGRLPTKPLYGFTRHAHKTVVPAITYLASIALFHHFGIGRMLFGVKPLFGVPSFTRVAIEVCMGVFLYDFLFYPFHLAFHSLRRTRRAHFRHHRWAAKETRAHNAVETVQNSYLDAGVQVFINICVQNMSPWGFKHPLSRALHNLIVTYLLCESHSGYDLPFQSHRVCPALFGGSPRHELHHARGDVCFHQFFKWIDDLRGSGPPSGTLSEGRVSLYADRRRRRAAAT
jgi:sterol desaturase/sphingolipid hydroxylase (fatty acid hydroxylase superfamily)